MVETKKYFQITTSFGREFEGIFEEVKKLRPDLKDNSKIAQEGVRELWKTLNRKIMGLLLRK